MKPSLTTFLLFGAVGLVVCVYVFFISIIYLGWENSQQLVVEHKNSLSSISSTGQVLTDLLDFETNYRGYVLTGKKEFLIPCQRNLSIYRSNVELLKGMSSFNKSGQKSFETLHFLALNKINFGIKICELYASEDHLSARNMIAGGKGQAIMDSIRSLVILIQTKERANLSLLDTQKQERENNQLLWLKIFSLFSFSLFFFVAIGIKRSVDKRINAESKLIALNKDLEQKVEERAKEVLKKELHYKNILDNLMEGVQIIDFNWRYVYINDALTRYSYHPKDQLIGYTFMEKFPGVEQTQLYKNLKQCMEERTARQMETAFFFPDGNKKDFELSIQPIPEGIFILSVDITDRKTAEKTEYELHARLKAIFDKTNDAIMLADDSGKYVQINPATVKMLGYSEQELIGKSAADIVSDRKSDELWNEFLQDGSQTGVIELVKKDKSLVICHYNATTNILPGLHLSILTNITEQKKVERDLIESEKKYRLLFQNNPLPMWMLQLPSYNITDVNDAAAIHYGYTRDEFLAMNARDLRPKEDLPLFENQIVLTKRQGTHHAGIWRHKKRNGEIIKVEEVAHDIKLEAQNMRVVLANDVTERERAEEELKQSEERLAQAQAVAKVGSWETDLKTLDVIWSRETYRIFEVEPENFQPVHSTFLSFVHPDDRSTVDDAFKNSAQHTGLNRIEHKIITAKDTVKYVEERWEILRTDTGEPVKAVGTCQNITERINTLEKTKQSEENYRFLFNNNPAVIFIWDLETLEIIEANEAAVALYGYTHQEFLNMTVLALRLPEEHEQVKTFARQMLHHPPPIMRANRQHIKKDGGTMMMDITWHPILYKGRPSIFSLSENITEKLLIEDELKRTYEDLRKLNSHLETVREEERAHISRELHDELGQQLTGIKMDMVWMGNKLSNTDVSTATRVAVALQLVDDTTNTLRRINSDLRPDILDDLGIYAAIDWHCDEFTQRTGIKCVVYQEDGTEPELKKNIGINIFRILQEALNNIAKHANATQVIVIVKAENEKIKLTINDNGKGFDKQQVRNKRTYGLLGMSERVIAINGQLQIESVMGKGTSIQVIIPLTQNQPPHET